MIYRFGFDRRTLVLLGVGSALGAVLIYCVGLLTGLLWATPAGAPEEASPAAPADSAAAGSAAPPVAPRSVKAPVVRAPTVRPPAVTPPLVSAPTVRPSQAAAPAEPAPAAAEEEPEAPPPALAEEPVLPVPETIYEIQVGAFLVEVNAVQYVVELARQGYAAYVIVNEASGGRDLFTVRIGPYPSVATAAKAAAAAREQLGVATVIRFRPKPAPVTAPASPAAPSSPDAGAQPTAGGEGGER